MVNVKAYVRLAGAKGRRLWRRALYWRPLRSTLYFLQHVTLPGNRGVPLYDVLRFFLVGVFNGSITNRAKGLAYSFLTALPPLLIFFFTLVAFFPVDGLQTELLSQLGGIVPEDEIRRLLDMGYQPVLAHPERYLYLEWARYHSLKEAGALFQRNVGAREGLYGEAVSQRCEALLAAGMYDLTGTDLHNERYADFFDAFGFHAGT